MQPEQPKNYWDKPGDEPKSDQINEMYQPTPDQGEDTKTTVDDSVYTRPSLKDGPVHWSALEYISNDKNKFWFIGFGLVVAAFIAIDLLFLHSYTFSILVVVMAAAVIVFSKRPARTINYTLSGDQGLYIGENLYHFSEFRAFGLIQEKGQHSLMLIPIKRFSPGVSVYFPEEVGERIVDIFGARLPMENLKLDLIDIIVQMLRL